MILFLTTTAATILYSMFVGVLVFILIMLSRDGRSATRRGGVVVAAAGILHFPVVTSSRGPDDFAYLVFTSVGPSSYGSTTPCLN